MSLATSFYKSALRRGTYRHYKGKLYQVMGTAKHSESEEDLVVYAPLDQVEGQAQLWVRPLGMFIETVTIDGRDMPRFAFVSEAG